MSVIAGLVPAISIAWLALLKSSQGKMLRRSQLLEADPLKPAVVLPGTEEFVGSPQVLCRTTIWQRGGHLELRDMLQSGMRDNLRPATHRRRPYKNISPLRPEIVLNF
jgi:hypothetical protein